MYLLIIGLHEEVVKTGIKLNELPNDVPETYRAELLAELVSEKLIVQTAGAYHLPTHEASLSEQEQALLDRLKPNIDVLQAPSIGDLSKTLNVPIPKLEAGMKALANRGLTGFRVVSDRARIREQTRQYIVRRVRGVRRQWLAFGS